MEEKVTTSKIVINEESELTDVVREIHRSKAERIILTFTEQTDLLISPINLKVLQESAQREKKLLIAQIIQNPTGIRNAKLANIKTIDSPSSPTEYDWEEAYDMVIESEKKKKEAKKIVIEKDDVDEKKEFEEKIVQPEIKEEEAKKDDEKEKEEKQDSTKGYVDKRGVKRSSSSFVSIDDDFPQMKELESAPAVSEDISTRLAKDLKKKGSIFKKGSGINIFSKLKTLNKKKALRIGLFALLGILIIGAIGGYLYHTFVPSVRVTIFVEAKGVEIESILTGEEDIESVDFENMLIPIKKESASQSLSDDITATGKAFKGEKATGSVDIGYNIGEECSTIEEERVKISLNSGHIFTTGGLQYKLVNSVEIVCNSIAPATLVASDIGEEYNIATNRAFVIEGYSTDDVFVSNDAAFTGGSKEEYTVLSQQDVDNAVEQLSTTAIEEVKSELRDLSKGWEIIEDSIKSEVDKDSIKTDKSVGQEATTVNLDLSIEGEALYYSTEGLMEELTTLLRDKAEEEKLFESEEDLELELGDDIETDISIESIKDGVVKVKIVASSLIKPDIDRNVIANKLKGMKWEEGRDYINTLEYSDKKASIVFQPENYPTFLKIFPERDGRIIIGIETVEKDE
jgi:hypothetical protein